MFWICTLSLTTMLILKSAIHNYSSICRQLGSGWDAEYLGVSSRSKLFDTQTFSSTMSHKEALWKLKQTRDSADNNLFGGLEVNCMHFPITYPERLLWILRVPWPWAGWVVRCPGVVGMWLWWPRGIISGGLAGPAHLKVLILAWRPRLLLLLLLLEAYRRLVVVLVVTEHPAGNTRGATPTPQYLQFSSLHIWVQIVFRKWLDNWLLTSWFWSNRFNSLHAV